MAFIPKTNWQSNETVQPADVNRWEQGIADAHTNKLDKTGDAKDATVTFTEASERLNINSTEKISVIAGKVKKWFADIATLFSSGVRLITQGEIDKLETTSGINSGDESTLRIGGLINGATTKTTPADNDMFAMMDSAAGQNNNVKKISWANIKTELKTFFINLFINNGDLTTITTIVGYADNDNASALTIQELEQAGVKGAILSKLDAYKVLIANEVGTNVNTRAKIQALIDTANLEYNSENLLINGNFDIWQRGTSFDVSTWFSGPYPYTADRWQSKNYGNFNASRQNASLNGSNYCMKVKRNSNGNDHAQLAYNMEALDSIKCRGKYITLSFYAKKGADFKSFGIANKLYASIQASTTTEDSMFDISTNMLVEKNCILTTSWQKFTLTVPAPISGSITQLFAFFSYDSDGTAPGADDSFYITQVKMNYGMYATPFMPKRFDQEYLDCMRFFEKSYNYGNAPGSDTNSGMFRTVSLDISTGNGNAWFLGAHPSFKVKKRVSPNVTLYSVDNAVGETSQWHIGGTLRTCSVSAYENWFEILNNTGGPITPAKSWTYGHWTADAEI